MLSMVSNKYLQNCGVYPSSGPTNFVVQAQRPDWEDVSVGRVGYHAILVEHSANLLHEKHGATVQLCMLAAAKFARKKAFST